MFIPAISLPFVDGYRRNAGLIENIQSMALPVVPDRYEPQFGKISPGQIERYQNEKYAFVDISSTGELPASATAAPDIFDEVVGPDSGKIRLFTNGHPDDEIAKALKANKKQIEDLKVRHVIFYGWTVSRQGLRLPFSLVVSASLLLAFSGVVLLIFTGRRT